MKSFKTSKLRVYNNNGHKYIYIFFKEDGHALKINTKLEYVKNKMTADNLYNSKMKDFNKLNGHIQEMQWVVDSYINLVSGHKPVNQQECQRYLKENKYHASKVPIETMSNITGLLEHYKKFLEAKKESPFLKPVSLKNYKSFMNFLTDFQNYKKRTLFLFDIDKKLINHMIEFSQVDLRKLKGYLSRGHLQQNTLKKRLDVFREFIIWLGSENIANFNTRSLFPKISKTNKDIVFVTEDEIRQLIETRPKIEGDYNKLVFDSFIFNCEAGLRFEDLSNLSESDFKKIPQGYILSKELHKHNERFASESTNPIVHPLLIDIIEKNNFHFELKQNSLYNRALHTLFKKHDLFTEPLIVKRKYIKGVVEEDKLLKNDVITCHSCRRSMITNAFIEGNSTAQVMQLSGHRSVKSVEKYSNFANDELLKKNLHQKLRKIKKVRIKHKN